MTIKIAINGLGRIGTHIKPSIKSLELLRKISWLK